MVIPRENALVQAGTRRLPASVHGDQLISGLGELCASGGWGV